MNLHGQPAFVGRHCGSHEYEVSRAVVDFYADALDDHHALYAELAPPLLYHSECYRFLAEWYLKNLIGNLHAQQDWEMFAPLRIGARVRTRSTIIERYHKRGRDYVVNETDIVDDEGRLCVRGRTHQSFLADAPDPNAAYVVDEKSAARKTPRPPFPTGTGELLAPRRKVVDLRRCWMFSGPHRSYHTDVEEAKKLGFPNVVVQGMMSTCFAAQVMLDRFGEGFLRGGKMSLKLTNVLWVDESVTARAVVREVVGEGSRKRVHCDVWVEKDDGMRVLLGAASAVE